MFILSEDNTLPYEQQIKYVERGIKYLDGILPTWPLLMDINKLGTYLPHSTLLEQLGRYIVLPPLTIEERILLGFLSMPDFLLTNTLEAIWALRIYQEVMTLKNKIEDKPTLELKTVTPEGEIKNVQISNRLVSRTNDKNTNNRQEKDTPVPTETREETKLRYFLHKIRNRNIFSYKKGMG